MQVALNNLYQFAKISKLINTSNSNVQEANCQAYFTFLHPLLSNLAPLKTDFLMYYVVSFHDWW